MSSKIRIVTGILLIAGAAAQAQADTAASWQHAVTPYLWGSGMSGRATLGTPAGPLEADVDVGFDDILRNLKIGGMVAYRGDRGPWSVMADAIYMNLEAGKASAVGPVGVQAQASVEQTALEADVGYRWTERVLLFAGLRYNAIDLDLDVTRSGPGAGANRAAGESASWVDPLVGAIVEVPLAPRWSLEFRGDVGGFGIGADLAWQAVVAARWKATDRVDVIGSYRYLDVDYDDGRGASLFEYDVATSGPGLGVTWRF